MCLLCYICLHLQFWMLLSACWLALRWELNCWRHPFDCVKLVFRYIKFDTFTPAAERGLPVTRVISRMTLQQILARAVGDDAILNDSHVVDFIDDGNKVNDQFVIVVNWPYPQYKMCSKCYGKFLCYGFWTSTGNCNFGGWPEIWRWPFGWCWWNMVKGNVITQIFWWQLTNIINRDVIWEFNYWTGEEGAFRAIRSNLFRIYLLHWHCRLCASWHWHSWVCSADSDDCCIFFLC